MKKIGILLFATLSALALSAQGRGGYVQAAGQYSEERIEPASMNMSELTKDKAGNVVSYYEEDDLNTKAVLRKSGKSWKVTYVKDSWSGSESDKKWYTIYPDEAGYVEISPDSKKMVLRSAAGKKKGTYRFTKFKGWRGTMTVSNVKHLSGSKYLLMMKQGAKRSARNVCVDVSKKKVLWQNKEEFRQVTVVGKKLYSYSCHTDRIGNPSKKSDLITSYCIKDGKRSGTIDLTPIRNQVTQDATETSKGTNAYPLTSQQIYISAQGGRIYAAYISGIYQYNAKHKSWKALIAADDKTTFTPVGDMEIVDFLVKSNKEFYLLASRGDYDGEVTDVFCYLKK